MVDNCGIPREFMRTESILRIIKIIKIILLLIKSQAEASLINDEIIVEVIFTKDLYLKVLVKGQTRSNGTGAKNGENFCVVKREWKRIIKNFIKTSLTLDERIHLRNIWMRKKKVVSP
jgi:hypothetical protein